jgi:hypothetical protein
MAEFTQVFKERLGLDPEELANLLQQTLFPKKLTLVSGEEIYAKYFLAYENVTVDEDTRIYAQAYVEAGTPNSPFSSQEIGGWLELGYSKAKGDIAIVATSLAGEGTFTAIVKVTDSSCPKWDGELKKTYLIPLGAEAKNYAVSIADLEGKEIVGISCIAKDSKTGLIVPVSDDNLSNIIKFWIDYETMTANVDCNCPRPDYVAELTIKYREKEWNKN